MKKKITFTLKADYNRKIDDIHQHIQEVKRGTGVVKSKKAYSRKVKHKKRDLDYHSYL